MRRAQKGTWAGSLAPAVFLKRGKSPRGYIRHGKTLLHLCLLTGSLSEGRGACGFPEAAEF